MEEGKRRVLRVSERVSWEKLKRRSLYEEYMCNRSMTCEWWFMFLNND